MGRDNDKPVCATYPNGRFLVGDIVKVNDGRIMVITNISESPINRHISVWYKQIYFSKMFIIRWVQKRVLNSIIKINKVQNKNFII
jgi:hypothetical protein